MIDERRTTFENKSVEEILALHKASMAIDYEEIMSVKVKKGSMGTRLEFIVRGPMRKVEFSIEEKQIAEVQEVLNKVLSDKLR